MADGTCEMPKMRLEKVPAQADNLIDCIAENSERIGVALERKLEQLNTEQAKIDDELSLSAPCEHDRTTDVMPLLDGFSLLPMRVKRVVAGELIAKILVGEG